MRNFYISGLLLLLLSIFLGGCGNSDEVTLVFEGLSMTPTIQEGDRIIANQAYYNQHDIQRGEVVLAEIEPEKLHVKRILGLPGERIQMGNGQLLIDGEPVSEEYIFQEITYEDLDRTLGDYEYFLLGDAMDQSRDSRHFGPITGEEILGKVIKIESL